MISINLLGRNEITILWTTLCYTVLIYFGKEATEKTTHSVHTWLHDFNQNWNEMILYTHLIDIDILVSFNVSVVNW